MMTIVASAFIVGGILGLFFRVFILLPTTSLAVGMVAIGEEMSWTTVVAMSLVWVALQSGYFCSLFVSGKRGSGVEPELRGIVALIEESRIRLAEHGRRM
jgi:hypothetical protein